MDAIDNIAALYIKIKGELDMYEDYVSNKLTSYTERLFNIVNSQPDGIKNEAQKLLYGLIDKRKKYQTVYMYSAALSINYDNGIFEEFLEWIPEEKGISPNTGYFLYYQLKHCMFARPKLESENAKYLLWKLLQKTVNGFKEELKDILLPIPREERDENFALVITEQILSYTHAPSKTAFERCKTMITKMQKQVFLINTAETMSLTGAIPFFRTLSATYNDTITEEEHLLWKGTAIPYFQCDKDMPDVGVIRTILELVRDKKPGTVISIGGSSIVGNLIDFMTPVLTVGLCPSDLAFTTTAYQTISVDLSPEHKRLLQRVGKTENHVIKGTFTYELPEQTTKFSRQQLGIPEEKFVLVTAGARLDTDIDGGFADMLKKAVKHDICIVLLGTFNCERFIKDNPELKGHVFYFGFVQDVLAYMEICDLFVNPERKGGGASAIEAMFKGIPAVSTHYGDVAANIGEDFLTDSYDGMLDIIMKYKNDNTFYGQMSKKAKARAEIVMDIENEFVRIIHEFKKRCEDSER